MPRNSRYSSPYDDDDISTLSSTTIGSLNIYSRRSRAKGGTKMGTRQSLAYCMIAFLVFIVAVFVSRSDPVLSTGYTGSYSSFSSSSSYQQSKDFHESYTPYLTLQNPTDVDASVERRADEIAAYYSTHLSEYNARCDNIMIYMPDAFAFHGHGSQLNTYLMAVLVSTYLDRPLLLLEPEGEWNKYEGGSQFGCPDDYLSNTNMSNGLSRLIDHPTWLHSGCSIPKCHEYRVWNQLSSKFNANGLSCIDASSGREVNTIVARGSPIRGYMREMNNEMMSNNNPEISLRWAMNLGASREEAQRFVRMRRANDKWDYVIGLMVKSGVLRLQPWIARDVQQFLQNVALPLDSVFDAIHVRRGDKLESESRGPVVDYWTKRGYTEKTMPLDFIPFSHYLTKTNNECPFDANGEIGIIEHRVYVATDDPMVVKQEIDKLIADDRSSNAESTKDGVPTLIYNGCHQFKFYFNPTQDNSLHLGGDGERTPIDGDNCAARYHRNIASMVDFMMLARSQTFIGEYNSNWGRLLRVVRMRLTDFEPFSALLDIRVAWGRDTVSGPGL